MQIAPLSDRPISAKHHLALLTVILLVAAFFRLHLLGQDIRFHPDEAFYSTFARNAAVNGDWMLPGALDKPPLTMYISALAMTFWGVTTDVNGVLHLDSRVGEFAVRLPNVLASLLLVAVGYRLARDLYRQIDADYHTIAITTALLLALSGYSIAFSATAFTDTLLLLCMTIALWLAARRWWAWSGVWMALSIACKPQGAFYLPLIVLLMVILLNRRQRTGAALRFLLTLFAGIALLLLWDAARPENSVFALGTVNNLPDSLLVAPHDLFPRLVVWLDDARWLFSPDVLTIGLIVVSLAMVIATIMRRRASTKVDLLLLAYIAGYGLLHWLLAFNQYDRYLLPILPLLAIVVARGVGQILRWQMLRHYRLAFSIVALMLLIIGAGRAGSGQIPIGGDRGDTDGIIDFADYLNDLPVATVIYDHWLGWELGYYMGQWTNKRRVYYPTPDTLVDGALSLDEVGARYLVAPVDVDVHEWITALESAGFTITLDYQSARFVAYRLIPPLRDASDGADVESSWRGRVTVAGGGAS